MKTEDIYDKISSLNGYLKIWNQGNGKPLELNDLINEVDEWLADFASQPEPEQPYIPKMEDLGRCTFFIKPDVTKWELIEEGFKQAIALMKTKPNTQTMTAGEKLAFNFYKLGASDEANEKYNMLNPLESFKRHKEHIPKPEQPHTKAVQKQDDKYHTGCQNCGVTDKPLQMIPLRNDHHVVGLLLACDNCKDELYGQNFDRKDKFQSLTKPKQS